MQNIQEISLIKQLGVLEFILSAADPEEKIIKWREDSKRLEEKLISAADSVNTAGIIAEHIIGITERYTAAVNKANAERARLLAGLERLRTQSPYVLSLLENRFFVQDTGIFLPGNQKETSKRAFAVALNSMQTLDYEAFSAACEPAAASELTRLTEEFDSFENQAVESWKNANILPALNKMTSDLDSLTEYDPEIKQALAENIEALREACLKSDECDRSVPFAWVQSPLPPAAYIPADWNVMPLIAYTVDVSVDTYVKNRTKELKKNFSNKQQTVNYKVWEISARISSVIAERSAALEEVPELTVPDRLSAIAKDAKGAAGITD